MRWQHPEVSLIAPDQFIPVAEETGLIQAIDHWVLSEACRQPQAWQLMRLSDAPIVISVNMSGQRLVGTDLFDRVVGMLQAYALDPSCVNSRLPRAS